MNESIVKILNVLKKSNDKNVIIKALIKLRTDIVKDKDGIKEFYKADGVLPMIKFLNRPHEKILDIVLSILGNCCTNQDCCIQALENKIILPLLTILKSIPNPSIQNRACRLLGNLARENKPQLLIHSTAIVQSLCLILEESIETPTSVMATRAAKFLLNDKDFLKTFIKFDGYKILISILCKVMLKSEKSSENDNVINNDDDDDDDDEEVPLVGLKINQHREKYFEEVARNLEGVRSDIFDAELLKKDKKRKNLYVMPDDKTKIDLVTEILKCLLIISQFPPQGTSVELLHPEAGLPCIVYFTDKNNTYRSLALKILSNFSKSQFAVTVLSSANAVVAACDLLTDSEAHLSEPEKKYCINIVCMLSSDACNRAKIRRSGALNELIQIARISSSFTEISVILHSLINFQYDSLSMDLMVRGGLIGILINELRAYLNSDQNNDEYRKRRLDEKKRVARKRKSESEVNQSTNKNQKIWDNFEQESPSASPSYYSPSSPCSSRGLSPVGSYSKNFLDDDNSDYSPVCSENEGDSDNEQSMKTTPSAPADEYDLLDKLLDIKTESNFEENILDNEDDDESRDEFNVKLSIRSADRNAIDIIDCLLSRISLSVSKDAELGKSETLNTIIEGINMFGLNSTSLGTSLNNILSEGKFFANILKQDITNQLFNMAKINELKMGAVNFIDTLTCVAQSNYGIGEILKILKNEQNSSAQKRAAIAVSFIIKKPQILYQLLAENGALYVLINIILNKEKEFQDEAVNAITALSHTLNITLPISDLTNLCVIDEFDETYDFSSNTSSSTKQQDENEVKFLIHRGCSLIPIKFNKKILSENSEVFNSMLNSDFREKSEREIHLHNYSVNGIKYFLNLLTLLSKNQNLNIPPSYHFDSILEAYELSKMYIMIDLEKKLYEMLIFRLDETNILKIFEWSLKNFNQDLSEIAINYYLCSELKPHDKVKLYREADYSKFSTEWNTMLIDAILVKCQNMCNEPNTIVYTKYKANVRHTEFY